MFDWGKTLLSMLRNIRHWAEKRWQLREIAKKIQAPADVKLAKIQTEAKEKRRADEIQMTQIQAAKAQAKIQAEKELALELKAQEQASTSAAADPPQRNTDAKSPKLSALIDEKDELSYLLYFERYAKNAKWEKNTWAI